MNKQTVEKPLKNKGTAKQEIKEEEPSEENNKKPEMATGLGATVMLSQLGLTMALPILLGALGGHWLDGKLGTGMIFFILLLCMGIAGGIVGAYRQIMDVIKKKTLNK